MRILRAAGLSLLVAGPLAAQDFTSLKGHGGPIMAIAVAADGRVATGSFDNSVGLWQGRDPLWLEGHAAAVTALTVTPSGEVISAGDDFAIRRWGTGAAAEIGRHAGKIRGLAVSPDGTWLASGSWDGTLHLWSLGPGTARALPDPGAGVNDVAFSSDGTALIAATMDGRLLRYDLAETGGTPDPLVRHGFGVNAISRGDGWIAYGAVDGGTRVIDAGTGAEIADFTLDRRPVLAMAHHAGTGQLAVGDGQGYIMIVDTESWQIARDYRATTEGPVWALAFSPDGSMLYAGGLDDVAYGWPVALLDTFDATMGQKRSFLRDADTMDNGERQFMRKCSICHALTDGPSRKAGPTLHGLFGRRAGTLPGYSYSPALGGADITWGPETIDALFDLGPDHYIPGSKMPMQVISAASDRADLVAFLRDATAKETSE
ncbi:c-type cytochrome [Marinibacterium profundimaris]|uniref:Cytochrome C n=1 Tax=Marinibacterium profundimaris TaxID=1679460 RepID=A0A225NL08_9RHOB|nr:c-type cytochrome [Marinibacterium profundimaris]OWU74757.1 cytochrome C [Marinibacterium profundimaris]